MRCNGMKETAERKKSVEQKTNESTDRMGKGCRANEMEIIKSEMWIIKCWRIQWKQKGQLGQSIARCSPTLTKTSFHIIVMRDWRFSSKTILNRSNVWQCQRQRRWWFFLPLVRNEDELCLFKSKWFTMQKCHSKCRLWWDGFYKRSLESWSACLLACSLTILT